MKKIVFILLLLIHQLAQAQRPIIDSLTREVKKIAVRPASFGRDTLLINGLWELTYYSTYFREKNTKSLLDSLQNLSNRTKWEAGKGMFLIDKAFYQSNFLNDFSKSLLDVLHAKEILKNTHAYKALAYANLRISSYMLWNLNNVSRVERFSIDGKKAAQEMILLGNKINDMDIKCQGLIYLANHFNSQHDAVEAHKNLKEAEEILTKNRVSYLAENVLYGTYGAMFSFTNQPEKAFEYWEKCLKIAYPQNDYYTLTSMNRLKAEYYWQYAKEKNFDLALKYAKESYLFAQELSILQFITLAEKNLYAIYRLKGNITESLKYLEFFKYHEDSLGRERIQKTYADYSLLQKETQIKTLENEKLQKENERQNFVSNLLIISLLAGVGLVLYFFKNNRQLKIKNREIEEALFKGQTIERKRVAAELHDNLSAKISGIKWRLEAIQPDFKIEKQKKIYESSINALSEVYTDVRLIAHNLLPIELETKGLAVAVENLVKELNSLEKTSFSLQITENIDRFFNKIEYEIFSIILELSNNILKHSGAKNALISICKEQNLLKLSVEDNGIGFSEHQKKDGMGMKNLQSRVESLGGKMEINSNDGVKISVLIEV